MALLSFLLPVSFEEQFLVLMRFYFCFFIVGAFVIWDSTLCFFSESLSFPFSYRTHLSLHFWVTWDRGPVMYFVTYSGYLVCSPLPRRSTLCPDQRALTNKCLHLSNSSVELLYVWHFSLSVALSFGHLVTSLPPSSHTFILMPSFCHKWVPHVRTYHLSPTLDYDPHLYLS